MLDKVTATATKKTADPIDRHVGQRVRLRRTMLGMSQETLAAGLGVTFQQVQKYEKGSNRIGAGRLQKIAETLNVSVSYFFEDVPGGDGCTMQESEIMSFINSPEGLQLNRTFARITDPHTRKALTGLIRTVAELARAEITGDVEIINGAMIATAH